MPPIANPVVVRIASVNLARDPVPSGFELIKGKHLQATARAANIPFGRAEERRMLPSGQLATLSVGILIRNEDAERWVLALATRRRNKEADSTYPSRRVVSTLNPSTL